MRSPFGLAVVPQYAKPDPLARGGKRRDYRASLGLPSSPERFSGRAEGPGSVGRWPMNADGLQ